MSHQSTSENDDNGPRHPETLVRSATRRPLLHALKGAARLFGPSLVVGLVAPYLFPVLRRSVKPAAKGIIKGALALGESVREGSAVAREQLSDLLAEVKAEREQESQQPPDGKNPIP